MVEAEALTLDVNWRGRPLDPRLFYCNDRSWMTKFSRRFGLCQMGVLLRLPPSMFVFARHEGPQCLKVLSAPFVKCEAFQSLLLPPLASSQYLNAKISIVENASVLFTLTTPHHK